MDLIPYIFHERQEPGSQLCAQHSLNNLLQEPCYTEVDLADVARKLDEAEAANTYTAPPTKSYNYDDTGYFSISVLEKALQVWDLTLVRWRGEAMRPYVDHPEEQAAFILNLANHWFTLRRFGKETRWYNLNSFLAAPEWISPTYLQMVLAQAEAEGYSVFAVRKAGVGAGEAAGEDVGEGKGWEDGGIGALPDSGADLMALQLGDVHDRRGSFGTNLDTTRGATVPENSIAGPSNSSRIRSGSHPPPYAAGSGRSRRRQEDLSSDFVEEQDLIGSHPSSRSRTPRAGPSGLSQRNRADVFRDDVAMLNELDNDVPDHDEELDDENIPDSHPNGAYGGLHGIYNGPTDFALQSRSYDDEDEALQAALKASMQGLPDGFVMPELPPIQQPSILKPVPIATPPAAAAPDPVPTESTADAKNDEEEEEIEEDDDDEPARTLSPEEIRAARLARFH